jgi:hypothetical protein
MIQLGVAHFACINTLMLMIYYFVPWSGFFFMTLFLSIFERSLEGYFWDCFWNFDIFHIINLFQNWSKGPFQAKVKTSNFFIVANSIFLIQIWFKHMLSFFWGVKLVIKSTFFYFDFFGSKIFQFWL